MTTGSTEGPPEVGVVNLKKIPGHHGCVFLKAHSTGQVQDRLVGERGQRELPCEYNERSVTR